MATQFTQLIPRPPVIAVMGHIDHGKSTLLDYIRKTNIVEKEVGGITQHISAYEVLHKTSAGAEQKITFLDTPGHEAFQKMRSRGAEVADIAILVVSSEEGVKPQTLEALASITECGIPYVVALTKIDKPSANVERTKQNLSENGIYLEGLGGEIPFSPVSSKTGEGIPELLDLLLLVAELQELTGDPSLPAEGFVIEANLDPKKGTSATLVIKNGTLRSGMFVVAGESFSPVRIMEDFLGRALKEATFSSPVRVIGFNALPPIGKQFHSVAKKKEAEELMALGSIPIAEAATPNTEGSENRTTVPIILKADVLGTIDAIEHELAKLKNDRLTLKVIHKGVGAISLADVKLASGDDTTLIVGFNVKTDQAAIEEAERLGITIEVFSIIYKLSEWLEDALKKRTPKIQVEEVLGRAKLLKTFSKVKDKQVIGGRVETGVLSVGAQVKVLRKGEEIGRGKILGLQAQKVIARQVEEGNEFGSELQSKVDIAAGDVLESFIIVEK